MVWRSLVTVRVFTLAQEGEGMLSSLEDKHAAKFSPISAATSVKIKQATGMGKEWFRRSAQKEGCWYGAVIQTIPVVWIAKWFSGEEGVGMGTVWVQSGEYCAMGWGRW